MSGEEPATQIAPVESPQMVSTVKLPILKKGEYTLWSMRMEQYLTNTDYSLWQVILNGDGPIQVTTDENGVETEVPPKTTAQALLARQRERKAKSIMLLAIPDEYQLRFHAIKDAKTLWAAIQNIFDSRSSDGDDNQTNDRFKKDNGYHVVPPPLTGNYMPPLADLSFAGLDDSVYSLTANKTSATPNTRISNEEVNTVRVNGVNTARQIAVSTVKGTGVTVVKASAGYSSQWLGALSDTDSLTFVQGNPQQALNNKGIFDSGLEYAQVLFGLKLEWITTGGGDSVERAITTAASLDAAQDSDNIIRTQTTAMPNVDIPQGMDTGGSPRRQDTMGGAPAQTRSERVLEQPIEPPLSEGHTSGSGEGRMEHQFELTANVPITPYDSPLPGGYTPGSDEGRLKLQELMTMCTKLSKQVLDLEKEKDAQAVEILRLTKRVKRLERQRTSSTSQPRRRKYRQVESSDDDLDEEDASKQGRSSDKTEPILIRGKKYLLIKELLEKMLNLQLEAEEESTMAFELIKFIKSMLEE
ncbi:hypothetical protein Tco_0605763 [Tanacetum coccineum]